MSDLHTISRCFLMFRFSDRENYAGLQLLRLICFDFQGGKFKLYLIPGSSVFTFDLRKLAHQISNVRQRQLQLTRTMVTTAGQQQVLTQPLLMGQYYTNYLMNILGSGKQKFPRNDEPLCFFAFLFVFSYSDWSVSLSHLLSIYYVQIVTSNKLYLNRNQQILSLLFTQHWTLLWSTIDTTQIHHKLHIWSCWAAQVKLCRTSCTMFVFLLPPFFSSCLHWKFMIATCCGEKLFEVNSSEFAFTSDQ